MGQRYDAWWKSPFTDIGGDLFSHQYFGRCADIEMKVVDCLEAYGLLRGKQKCDELIQDFNECSHRNKQNDRIKAMRYERERQWLRGERSKKNHYAPPPKDDSF